MTKRENLTNPAPEPRNTEEILDGVHEELREEARKDLEYSHSNQGELTIGFEWEYPIVDSNFRPVEPKRRDEAIDDIDFLEQEVGGSLVELVTEPESYDSLSEIAEKGRRLEREPSEEDPGRKY